MRVPKRVVQTAALIRDRPAGVVTSATRAICQCVPHSACDTTFRLAVPVRPQISLGQFGLGTDLHRSRAAGRTGFLTLSLYDQFALDLPPAFRAGVRSAGG
jgi:hypothetical protein